MKNEMYAGKKKTVGKLFLAYLPGLLLAVSVTFCLCFNESQAAAAERIKIGLLEEPKTLNIWLATDAWSNKVLSLIYNPLYIREPETLKMIPWLAETDPEYDPDSLSYTIRLRSARWSDGSALTAEDVAFTGNLIKEFKIPRFYSRWKFVKKIETVDDRTVRFVLEEPKALFLTRTLTTPMVSKKEWEHIVEGARRSEKPLNHLINYKMQSLLGTGPFNFVEWRQGAYLFLETNKHFFGQGKKIQGRLLGPYIHGIVFKIYGTADAAILAIRKGSIDMFWWSIQPGYLSDLMSHENVRIFSNEKSALYYMGFNLRKRPFDDVHFRHAVASLVDKDFIVKRILQGYADQMNSIVPPGNTFWHAPDLPDYGSGLTTEARIRQAHKILREAGYTWKVPPINNEGGIVEGEGILLPDGTPMEGFTILTPPSDYDPNRAMTGIMIQEWLRMAGIPARSKPMAFSALTQQVNAHHQFDMFVLGYGNLSLDPDYLRNFFHSSNDRPRAWNASGYRNPDFDRIADESSRAMQVDERRELIRQMQRIIMKDIPYLPLYSPRQVEATRDDRFTNWVQMLGGIGNIWSFCQIIPK
ncbi:MAG: ABC transporter substrate-binding protein [Desulfatiglandaceae bacterium]